MTFKLGPAIDACKVLVRPVPTLREIQEHLAEMLALEYGLCVDPSSVFYTTFNERPDLVGIHMDQLKSNIMSGSSNPMEQPETPEEARAREERIRTQEAEARIQRRLKAQRDKQRQED